MSDKPYSKFSLEGHLGANSDAYKAFKNTHEVKTPEVGEHIDPQYVGSSELKLTGPEAFNKAQSAIEAEVRAKTQPDYKTPEAEVKALETHGQVAHTHLDRTERAVGEARKDLGKHVDAIKADITSNVKSGKLTADEGKAAHEALSAQAKEVEAHFTNVESAIKDQRSKVKQHTGVESKAKEFKAPGGTSASAVASTKAAGKHTEYEFDKMGKLEKLKTATAANWEKSGKWGKGVRVIGTGAGALLVAKGAKDLLADIGGGRADEKGDKIPSGAGDIVGDAIKIGAGAGAVYLSLVAGGKGHAIGK
jgi:polyhydroxyalkanoate synthesis regulator phasin